MAVSSFPVLSSLSASINISPDVSLFSLNLSLVNICSRHSTHPSSSIVVCSNSEFLLCLRWRNGKKILLYLLIFCNWTLNCVLISESGNDTVTERKKKLLEQYGLDPNEFLSEPSTNVGSSSIWSMSSLIYFETWIV